VQSSKVLRHCHYIKMLCDIPVAARAPGSGRQVSPPAVGFGSPGNGGRGIYQAPRSVDSSQISGPAHARHLKSALLESPPKAASQRPPSNPAHRNVPLPKQITSHHSNCQDQAPLKNPPSVEPAESYINKQCLTRTGTNSGNQLPPLPRGGAGKQHLSYRQMRISWMIIACPTPPPSHFAYAPRVRVQYAVPYPLRLQQNPKTIQEMKQILRR